MDNELIKLVEQRSTVEIHLPDGRVYSGLRGTTLENFFSAMPDFERPQIVGAVVNGELRELTYPVDMDARVKPVTIIESDGTRLYRRGLTFLLEAAFEDLFPDSTLTIDYSVASGGYFCRVLNREALTREDLATLETRMHEMVKENICFEREIVPLEEAIQYFESKGETDKARLLRYRQKKHLVLYRLKNHRDYHHGYVVPSTGYLRWFAITSVDRGFIIRFPQRQDPHELIPVPESPRLLATFQEYGDWLERLGIDNVGALNDGIKADRIRQIILVSEALHAQKIVTIADHVLQQANHSRIVLIAGPSSSGKTTFSKLLTVAMLAHGLSPFPLEMDNYFVDRELTPKDKNGNFDFEALEAMDTQQLTKDLLSLISGQETQLRKYDFKTGKSGLGDIVKLHKDQMIILEGIHGLNPHLIPEIPEEQTFRIYVSCLTQLNLDRHNRISTTDTRLLRRIVRDTRERSYTAQQTISRWESVRRGEKKHIFPFQENALEMFNSALVYELSVLKVLAEPLLRQVPYGTSEYIEAKRLLAFLDWFLPLETTHIPDTSILREFVGNSSLKDFKLWENGN